MEPGRSGASAHKRLLRSLKPGPATVIMGTAYILTHMPCHVHSCSVLWIRESWADNSDSRSPSLPRASSAAAVASFAFCETSFAATRISDRAKHGAVWPGMTMGSEGTVEGNGLEKNRACPGVLGRRSAVAEHCRNAALRSGPMGGQYHGARPGSELSWCFDHMLPESTRAEPPVSSPSQPVSARLSRLSPSPAAMPALSRGNPGRSQGTDAGGAGGAGTSRKKLVRSIET